MYGNKLKKTNISHIIIHAIKYFVIVIGVLILNGEFDEAISANSPNNHRSDITEKSAMLLNAIANKNAPGHSDIKQFQINAFSKKNPMWPVYCFLVGEFHRLNGHLKESKSIYIKLVDWAISDPYNDTWGGCGLIPFALWRWTELLNQEKTPDPTEVNSLVKKTHELQNSRFMKKAMKETSGFLGSFPQLREDLLRRQALLSNIIGDKQQALQLFLNYILIAGKLELNETENKLYDELISSGKVALDFLNLERGKHLRSLRMYTESKELLIAARKSENLNIYYEATYILSKVYRNLNEEKSLRLELLNEIIEDADDERLVEKALFDRYIITKSLSMKKRKKTEKDIQDLLEIISDYPDGSQANEAICQLAKFYEWEGQYEKSLKYYDDLRNFKGRNKYLDTAHLNPSLVLYQLGSQKDLKKAKKLLEKYTKRGRYQPFYLSALFWLGRISEDLQDSKKATFYFRSVIDEFPYNYYAIRSRIHLLHGSKGKSIFMPDEKILDEFNQSYQISLKAHLPIKKDTIYHQRLILAFENGLYKEANQGEQLLRKVFPSKRQEQLDLKVLSDNRLFSHLVLLFSLRQDTFAATVADSSISNLVSIARSAGKYGNDWPLTIRLIGLGGTNIKGYKMQHDDRYIATAFPPVYNETIKNYAKKYNVPASLLYAVMQHESQFCSSAFSKRSGLGFFQFIPSTFDSLDKMWGILKNSDFKTRESFLFNPESSLMLGARYFREELLDRYEKRQYKPEIIFALMDHNAGAGNVKKWYQNRWEKEKKTDDMEYMVDTIRFFQTRKLTRQIYELMVIAESSGMFN